MKKRFGYKNQFLGTACLCLIAISHGILLAWMSPATLFLQSDKSPFQITNQEVSFLVACFLIGSIVLGSAFCGICVHFFGRKIVLWLLGLPHVGFWLLVYFSQDIVFLYIARILAGFTSGGIMMTVTTTITEFSNKNIRANLSSCFPMSINLGRLLGSVIMGYAPFYVNPYIFTGIPILFMIIYNFFPETPQQLVSRGHEEKAKASLRFYRNLRKEEDDNELDNLFNEMKTQMIDSGQMGKVTLADFKSKQAFKNILQAIVLVFILMSSGTLVMFNAVGSLYQKVGSDPHIGTITYAVTQLFSATLATFTSNLYPRRSCLIISSIIAGILLISAGVFCIFIDNNQVVKVVWVWHIIFNIAVVLLQLGINSLSHCVAAELFPLKTKTISLAITYTCATTLSIGITTAFPYVLLEYERFGVFFALLMCASVCFFGAIFYIFVLPETSRKDI